MRGPGWQPEGLGQQLVQETVFYAECRKDVESDDCPSTPTQCEEPSGNPSSVPRVPVSVQVLCCRATSVPGSSCLTLAAHGRFRHLRLGRLQGQKTGPHICLFRGQVHSAPLPRIRGASSPMVLYRDPCPQQRWSSRAHLVPGFDTGQCVWSLGPAWSSGLGPTQRTSARGPHLTG